ncbi:hypothetical protein BDW59DRAFT_149591 [Aspergillus cavernicola]|uniref:Uncharacterized protein n=1 Tax=Aspergillus cavernicola TaxID=176166 RepID=A0ABR4I394_9EURO
MTSIMDCITFGNDDLYGYGIWCGLYLQFVALVTLRRCGGSLESLKRTRMTAIIICFAITLNTVSTTIQGSALSTDYLLTYYLTVVLFFSETCTLAIIGIPDTEKSTESDNARPDGFTLLHNALSIFNSGFGIWFWIAGIERTQQPQPLCGGGRAAIYWKTFDITSPIWRTFAALSAMLAGLGFTAIFYFHATEILARSHTAAIFQHCLPRSILKVSTAVSSLCAGLGSRIQRRMDGWNILRVLMRIFWILLEAFATSAATLSVAKIVRANHLELNRGMLSSGNLIPFLMGLTSLVDAAVDVIRGSLKRRAYRGQF